MLGTLFVISAPSGAGKTSLVSALVETTPGVELSVSHTTRPQRSGEIDGVHYHFTTAGQFSAMVDDALFLEHARVFDNQYGTARAPVEDRLHMGSDLVLEIDWQGARQVRRAMPEVVSIFILPPSREELERRLRTRGQDADAVIARRMRAAVDEMSHHDEYDYLVVNEVFGDAVAELRAIILSRRLRGPVQRERYRSMLEALIRPGSASLGI